MKVLLAGDLRDANNYGAVATTESLIKLLSDHPGCDELKLIGHRSFNGMTPVGGWPDSGPGSTGIRHSVKEGAKRAARALGVLPAARKVKKSLFPPYVPDNVPVRFDRYSEMEARIAAGETWQYEKGLAEWADIIVINSEGNIVNGTDADGKYRIGGRYVLFFAYLAKHLFHKPCYLINHTVDPKNRDAREMICQVYPMLDGVFVREQLSCRLLDSWGIGNYRYVPDALWSMDFDSDPLAKSPACLEDFDFGSDYICIGDSSGIKNNYNQVKWDVVGVYSRLIRELKKSWQNIIFIDGYSGGNDDICEVIRKNGLRSVNLNTCSYHELYYVLKHASLFLSGRWHASILSLLGHTPVLLWGSDSHKTEALYTEVGYPYKFFDVDALPLNIDRVAGEAGRIAAEDHGDTWLKVESLKEASRMNADCIAMSQMNERRGYDG